MGNGVPQPLYRRQMRFESLESRRVLATITVDTLLSENNGVGQGAGTSLQEAVLAAASGDTIDFSVTGTIKLTMWVPDITKSLTIRGPGANLLTIDANDRTPATKNGDGIRVFTIRDNKPQNLLNVSISGLTLTGGDTSTYDGGGGAISSFENLVVSDCVIVGNGSGYGNNYGGAAIQSIPEGEQNGLPNSLTVRNTVVSGNTSVQGEGGGIRKRFGTLLVEDCIITGNSTYWDGGGISASDSVTVQINRSTISNNWTTYPGTNNSYGDGGGARIFNGSMTIVDSTISGNTGTKGGGVSSNRFSNLTVTNSTVSGNTALVGGGIYAFYSVVTNSTLSGNTATSAGALYGAAITISSSTIIANTSSAASPGAVKRIPSTATTKVSSSIIAGNINGDIASGGLTSQGYNLVGGNSGFTATGDVRGVTDPMLGPLTDNGGLVKTHMPLPGSLAIDTGNPTFNPANPDGNASTNDAMPFDERGKPFGRVYDGDGTGGARIDKGAVERQPVPAVVMGDYNQDGVVDGGDQIVWQKARGVTGITAYTSADGTGDGAVDQADYVLWRRHFGSTVPVFGAGSGAGQQLLVAGAGSSVEESGETAAVSNEEVAVLPLFDMATSQPTGASRVVKAAAAAALEYQSDEALLAWVGSLRSEQAATTSGTDAPADDVVDGGGEDGDGALDAAFVDWAPSSL